MAAAYDNFDYLSYWKGRDYEHESEAFAIREFLKKVPKGEIALEIGAGYGRLVPFYENKVKKVILTDPSVKTLKLARMAFREKKFSFIEVGLENLQKYIKKNSISLVIFVRVLHHISKPECSFEEIGKMIKPGGFLVLEYANKSHFKATLRQFLRGNFRYHSNLETTDTRSIQSIKKRNIPFHLFHPFTIKTCLEKAGFAIIEKRSVSNIRSRHVKMLIPIALLIYLEKKLQAFLATINFGPSIFILARKV